MIQKNNQKKKKQNKKINKFIKIKFSFNRCNVFKTMDEINYDRLKILKNKNSKFNNKVETKC